MPVSKDFKASVADLLVRKQTVDVTERGRPPDDDVGTHIKQPLARPKMDKSNVDQTRLALAAVESLKARQGKMQAASVATSFSADCWFYGAQKSIFRNCFVLYSFYLNLLQHFLTRLEGSGFCCF